MQIVDGTKRHAPSFVAAAFMLAFAAAGAAPREPSAISSASVAPTVAARPWYASDLAALGFDIFRDPVPIPDFTLPSLGGNPTKVSSLRGKVVLLNFWATWCPPCRAEMPSIQKLWVSQKGGAFAVMAVSVGEKESTVKAFIAKEKYGFPVYLDAKASVGGLYGADSIPTTYVIDKDGKAIARIVGSIEYDSPEALSIFSRLASR
jgi:peroxiredoxin